MTWKIWAEILSLLIALAGLGYTIYDHYPKPINSNLLYLDCPARMGNAETTKAFKKTAFDLWSRKQKNEIEAIDAWQKTFDNLVAEINRKQPRPNGSYSKARALFCLNVMLLTGDNEIKVALQNFEESNKAMNKPNWYWIADRMLDGDNNKRPESFEIWRENLYARAKAGDLKAQSDIKFLESKDLGVALSN